MSGSLEGKVCLVTGAARGQGRNHARRLAAEGASIVAFDICAEAAHVGYPTSTEGDLAETVALVEGAGGKIASRVGDVRVQADLDAAVSDAVSYFGRLDVVVANAAICNWGRFWEHDDEYWLSTMDINLTGVWRTFKAAVPLLLEQGRGGSLIAISSVCGLRSLPGQVAYSASKHGVVGLVRGAALELGEYGIRVNSIHPWGVQTEMINDAEMATTLETHPHYLSSLAQALPDPLVAEPDDISNAVIYLASDASRATTGIQLPVDMGRLAV